MSRPRWLKIPHLSDDGQERLALGWSALKTGFAFWVALTLLHVSGNTNTTVHQHTAEIRTTSQAVTATKKTAGELTRDERIISGFASALIGTVNGNHSQTLYDVRQICAAVGASCK